VAFSGAIASTIASPAQAHAPGPLDACPAAPSSRRLPRHGSPRHTVASSCKRVRSRYVGRRKTATPV
jgi:hypothetical protein